MTSAGAAHELNQPRACLTTVARNLLLHRFHRQSLEQAYWAALAALPEPLALSAEEQTLIYEAIAEVDALLATMPAAVREAFLLA